MQKAARIVRAAASHDLFPASVNVGSSLHPNSHASFASSQRTRLRMYQLHQPLNCLNQHSSRAARTRRPLDPPVPVWSCNSGNSRNLHFSGCAGREVAKIHKFILARAPSYCEVFSRRRQLSRSRGPSRSPKAKVGRNGGVKPRNGDEARRALLTKRTQRQAGESLLSRLSITKQAIARLVRWALRAEQTHDKLRELSR